jgi:hypothetical protein
MRLPALISVGLALGIVAWGNTVAAAPQPDPDVMPMAKRWYGWQTLSLDAAALGLGLASFASNDGQGTASALLGSGALSTYAFGAPALHLLRGHEGKAVMSLGLRVGVPVLAASIASIGRDEEKCSDSSPEFDPAACQPQQTRMMVITAFSALAVSLADGAFIAWQSPPKSKALALSPLVAWDGEKSAMAGLSGTF